MAFQLQSKQTLGRGQVRYDLVLYPERETVGFVERGMSQGGYRASDYQARVNGRIVATGRTLRDLEDELREVESAMRDEGPHDAARRGPRE